MLHCDSKSCWRSCVVSRMSHCIHCYMYFLAPQFYVSVGLVLLTRCDAITSLSANGSAAFKWKLRCHWLKGFWRHLKAAMQFAVGFRITPLIKQNESYVAESFWQCHVELVRWRSAYLMWFYACFLYGHCDVSDCLGNVIFIIMHTCIRL